MSQATGLRSSQGHKVMIVYNYIDRLHEQWGENRLVVIDMSTEYNLLVAYMKTQIE